MAQVDSSNRSDCNTQEELSAYAEVLGSLHAHNLESLNAHLAENAEFADPFHRVYGRHAFMAIMDDMFKRLDDVRFDIHQVTPHPFPMRGGFLHWTFTANSNLTGRFSFNGVSRIEINDSGLVALHEDYWDSAELYRRIPVIKGVFNWLRKRTAAKTAHR